LATLKRLATEIAAKEPAEDRLNPFAVEIGLAVPIANIDEPGVRRGKNFYEFMLELCERLFDAEIDSATFEENLRYMWGIKAFPAFTVDKLVASMIKNVS
jgi:paired amphipathic helix protein Sin3a